MDQRHFSEEAFLHATLIEFVKCLGSGKRAHMFVESIDCGTFESFSNFLGNPGMEHNLRWRRPWRRQDILSVIVITNMDMIQRQHNRATKRKGNKIKPSLQQQPLNMLFVSEGARRAVNKEAEEAN